MATTTDPAAQADATLIQKVTYPTFFEKVAAVAHVSPATREDADELIKVAHVVGTAVARAVDRHLKADEVKTASAVKAAAASALAIAGMGPKPVETKAASFLEDAAVLAAAQAVFADQTKRAGLDSLLPCPAPTVPAPKTAEEEEEEAIENKKK